MRDFIVGFFGLVSAIIIAVLFILWEAWIVFSYWNLLPFTPITMLHAFSAIMIYSIVTYKYAPTKENKLSEALLSRTIVYALATALYYWVI